MTAMTIGDTDPALTVYKDEPFNAGTPLALLRRDFITPHSLFYARNHGSIPTVDPASYRLTITGDVRTEISLSLDALRRDFPSETVTATLQCAGNRRAELMAVKDIPGESPWTADAIGAAAWTGVPLHAALEAAGVGEEARHVAFTGLDTAHLEGHTFNVGGSIPLDKAWQSEVLLAYAMNDDSLSARHGFPLRVVVPGYAGIRSIKWLGEIRVQAEPSDSYTHRARLQAVPATDRQRGGRLGRGAADRRTLADERHLYAGGWRDDTGGAGAGRGLRLRRWRPRRGASGRVRRRGEDLDDGQYSAGGVALDVALLGLYARPTGGRAYPGGAGLRHGGQHATGEPRAPVELRRIYEQRLASRDGASSLTEAMRHDDDATHIERQAPPVPSLLSTIDGAMWRIRRICALRWTISGRGRDDARDSTAVRGG